MDYERFTTEELQTFLKDDTINGVPLRMGEILNICTILRTREGTSADLDAAWERFIEHYAPW